MARTSLCTASLLLLVICGNSGAQSVALQEIRSPGVYFQSEDPESYLAAPALGSFVQLQVSGLVARGTVTQIFYNPTDEWLGGGYRVPPNPVTEMQRPRAVQRLSVRPLVLGQDLQPQGILRTQFRAWPALLTWNSNIGRQS